MKESNTENMGDINLSTERSRMDEFSPIIDPISSGIIDNGTNPIVKGSQENPLPNDPLDELLSIGGSKRATKESDIPQGIKISSGSKLELAEEKIVPVEDKNNSYNIQDIKDTIKDEISKIPNPSGNNSNITINNVYNYPSAKLLQNETIGGYLEKVIENNRSSENIRNESSSIKEITPIIIPPTPINITGAADKVELENSNITNNSTLIVPSYSNISTKKTEISQPVSTNNLSTSSNISTINSASPEISNVENINKEYSINSTSPVEIVPSFNTKETNRINEINSTNSFGTESSTVEFIEQRPQEINKISILPSESTSVKEVFNTDSKKETIIRNDTGGIKKNIAEVKNDGVIGIKSEEPRLERLQPQKIREIQQSQQKEDNKEEIKEKPKSREPENITEKPKKEEKTEPQIQQQPPQIQQQPPNLERLESLMAEMVHLLKQPLITIDGGIKYS